MCLKRNEDGFIDSNYITTNSDGYNICKSRIRSFRMPEIGDKFSSRHGQKGTIGMIYNQEDMPFSSNGITLKRNNSIYLKIYIHSVLPFLTSQVLSANHAKSCTFS